MLSAVGRLPSYWGGDGLLSPAINLSTATHYPYLRLERLAEGAHQLHRSICFSVLAVYLFVAVRDPIRTFSFTRIAMSGPDGLASVTTSAGNGAQMAKAMLGARSTGTCLRTYPLVFVERSGAHHGRWRGGGGVGYNAHADAL